MVRVRGDDGVPGNPHARVPLHLAQGRTRMGLGTFFTSKLDEAIGWARKFSIFQYPFVTACCGMEYMATACSHYDVDRFGAGLPRFSPRQADVLFVSAQSATRWRRCSSASTTRCANPSGWWP